MRICHALLGATGCLLFVNTRNCAPVAIGGPGIEAASTISIFLCLLFVFLNQSGPKD
jgi:hypothetical protein